MKRILGISILAIIIIGVFTLFYIMDGWRLVVFMIGGSICVALFIALILLAFKLIDND